MAASMPSRVRAKRIVGVGFGYYSSLPLPASFNAPDLAVAFTREWDVGSRDELPDGGSVDGGARVSNGQSSEIGSP